jgi:AcrR family transcriptional regulator
VFYNEVMKSSPVEASDELPEAPRLTGRRRERPSRRTAITREAVVAAAIEVLDESGVTGLSMRRVADRLGTGPASLYAHISNKEELLELIYDELVGQVPLVEPDPEHWREQVHQMMNSLLEVLVSHRDAALAGLGRVPTSPKTLDGAETLSAVLKAGGISNRVIALGIDQLILNVSACAFEAGLFDQRGLEEEEIWRYMTEIHEYYDRLPADRYPTLAVIAPDMTGHSAKERFSFGVDLLIDGMLAATAREAT